MAEKLYTVPQVMEHLQLSRVRVYELINSGELESMTIGRARRITETALQNFIDRAVSA